MICMKKFNPLSSELNQWVNDNNILLFMKGDPAMPLCGYSNFACEVLKYYSSLILTSDIKDFKTVNILQDNELREAVKKYSNWPTYPQLYINGKLIGGADIINEMHKEGELKELLSPYEQKEKASN